MVSFSLLKNAASGGIPLNLDTGFQVLFLASALTAALVRQRWYHAFNAWLGLTLFSAYVVTQFLKLR